MKAVRVRGPELSSAAQSRLNHNAILTSDRFMRLWEGLGGEPAYWTAEEDGKCVAVLPGMEFGRPPVRRWQAGPSGLAAHLVVLEPQHDSPQFLGKVAETLISGVKRQRYASSTLNDYHGVLAVGAEWDVHRCEVEVIDLTSEWLPPDKKLQSEIRKACRDGVEVRAMVAADLEQAVQLAKATESRHIATVKYGEGFFRNLAALSWEDDRVVWQVAVKDGTVVASQVYLMDQGSALYWHAHGSKEFSHLKATQVLLFETARLLQGLGIQRLNLGATPADATGLRRFKEKWGGSTYEYNVYQTRSLLGKVL